MERVPLLDRSGRILEIVPKTEAYERLTAEFHATSDVQSFALPQVALMLFRSTGELILVRRGESWENPHLWDRTVVGHVSADEGTEIGGVLSEEACFAAMHREAREELGVELSLLPSKHALLRAYADGALDTVREGHVYVLDTMPWYANLLHRKDHITYMKRIFKTVYVGVYDGPIVFPDGEAEAVATLSLAEVGAAIAEKPFGYTWDLPEYLRRYGAALSDFSETLRTHGPRR